MEDLRAWEGAESGIQVWSSWLIILLSQFDLTIIYNFFKTLDYPDSFLDEEFRPKPVHSVCCVRSVRALPKELWRLLGLISSGRVVSSNGVSWGDRMRVWHTRGRSCSPCRCTSRGGCDSWSPRCCGPPGSWCPWPRPPQQRCHVPTSPSAAHRAPGTGEDISMCQNCIFRVCSFCTIYQIGESFNNENLNCDGETFFVPEVVWPAILPIYLVSDQNNHNRGNRY